MKMKTFTSLLKDLTCELPVLTYANIYVKRVKYQENREMNGEVSLGVLARTRIFKDDSSMTGRFVGILGVVVSMTFK